MSECSRELALANRVLVHQNILDAYGHVSVRDPRDETRFLLATYLPASLVSAADIRAFDFTGELAEPEDCQVYSERFIHAAIYPARPDVRAVCHTHVPELVAFGVSGVELSPVFHMAGSFGPRIPIFDDYDPDRGLLINNLEQGGRLANVLGNRKGALMRGHGAVITGSSVQDVVMSSVYLAQNARIWLAAATLGNSVATLTDRECLSAGAMNGREASLRRAWAHFTGLLEP